MLEKWIILVDPDSNHFYSMNLSTYQIYLEKDVPASMRKKAGQTIRNINQLLKLDNPHWLYESNFAKNYRFRKLQPYLLKKITCEFPLYICNSDLSLAFAEVTSIDLEILLTQYQKEIVDFMVKAGGYHPKVTTILPMNVSLLTSADEILKNILREIYREYDVKLKPKNGMKFVLRIFGYREYLAGGTSLLSYDRIRLILRGVKKLRVMLTEIKKIDSNSQLLLPIFERDSVDIINGIYTEIDWNKFLEAPLFLWYPPFKLPIYKTEAIFNQQEYQQNRNEFDEKFYEEISKPRVLNQKCMEEFKEMRRNDYHKGIIHIDENSKLYTGECDWVFRIKILGIENLFKIFEQANEKNQDPDDPHKFAIFNGLLTPNFITKTFSNKTKEEHLSRPQSHKRKNKSQEKNKRSLTPKLIKSKERESSVNSKMMSSPEAYLSKHTHHGISQGGNRFATMAKLFGLNFTPYLIQINAYLYFGCKLLVENAQAQTYQIPLSGSPKWNHWLEFPVRISQLPQEARICFDILVLSSIGDSQIIASTTFQLFDLVGEYQQGLKGLNLWPFYRHEPRLSCSGEFWGLSSHPSHSYKETEEFISKEYAKLFVTSDQFLSKMYWSNRDTELMRMMCLPDLRQIEEPKTDSKFFFKVVDKMKHLKGVLLKNDYVELEENVKPPEKYKDWHEKPNIDDLTKLQKLLNLNPLDQQELKKEERFILLKCRNHYKSLSKALPIFLSAIDWADPEQVGEVHKILKEWAPLTPQEALPLLDAHFADEAVRLYAVERISNFTDDELALYMLELTQALMFENLHFSPLSEFLLERSLANPFMVAHPFFWNLRSQLHLKPSSERFTLILEDLLMLCGQFREELFSDAKVNDSIMQIAEEIQKSSSELEAKKKELQPLLKSFKVKFQLSSAFGLAIDPRWEVEDFIIEKCNVMNSKKLPLWLVCQNSQKDAPSLKLLFKCGDDLRQDQLAMQLIQIMDKIWLDNGLDFRMKPYKVLATLDQVGMIEVVLNAETTSKIHKKYGGKLGALKVNTIKDYLLEFNKIEGNELSPEAIDNFIRSCAGYCVATYILGIGDRHSGNIMVTNSGHLFHIDFGHFLGNFKTKFGTLYKIKDYFNNYMILYQVLKEKELHLFSPKKWHM